MEIPGINQEKMIKSVINLAEILKKIQENFWHGKFKETLEFL